MYYLLSTELADGNMKACCCPRGTHGPVEEMNTRENIVRQCVEFQGRGEPKMHLKTT